jgi:hypothetical protein
MTGEEMIGSIFGLRPEDALTREPSERSTTDAPESSEPLTMRWSNSTSQKVIPAVGYGWLTLATIGCCAVALAAGASIASGLRTRSGARIIGLLIVLFLIGGLTYGAYVGFTRYLVGYPVEYLRYGMGGLALLAGAIGLAISPQGRGLRRVTRLAACLLIISAVASAVGVYLWRQAGAIEPQYATAAMLALIFAAHSAWGWVLFIFSFRI